VGGGRERPFEAGGRYETSDGSPAGPEAPVDQGLEAGLPRLVLRLDAQDLARAFISSVLDTVIAAVPTAPAKMP
jgi:hypothetical protein